MEAYPNNIPIVLTSIIGRERDMEEIKALLKQGRLVTLTGTGGCGKTRLALEVAMEVMEEFPDGVFVGGAMQPFLVQITNRPKHRFRDVGDARIMHGVCHVTRPDEANADSRHLR